MSREHGSAGARGEQATDNQHIFESPSTCSRFGCDRPIASVHDRGDAVVLTCESGHVEHTVLGSVGADGSSASTPVDESSTPEGVTRGAVDGTLDRQNGYDSSRPDADDVGSDPDSHTNDRNVPVLDPSSY